MPFIDITIARGTLTPEQKRQLLEKVGDAAIAVEGEARRPLLNIALHEIELPAIVGGRVLDARK